MAMSLEFALYVATLGLVGNKWFTGWIPEYVSEMTVVGQPQFVKILAEFLADEEWKKENNSSANLLDLPLVATKENHLFIMLYSKLFVYSEDSSTWTLGKVEDRDSKLILIK